MIATFISRTTLASCFLVIALNSANAATAPRDPLNNGKQAYAGSGVKCLITNDFYAINFTAMQEGQEKGENTPFVKYCREIPAAGKVFLSVDLLDKDVRTTPLSLRVIEEEISDGRLPEIKRTVTETPPKIYKNGTADIVANLTQPGHYALIVTIGDQGITEDDRLRIPFSVAVASPNKSSNWLGKLTGTVVVLFFSIMGYIGYRTYRAYRPHRVAEGTLISS